jgi:hypothetical protein
MSEKRVDILRDGFKWSFLWIIAHSALALLQRLKGLTWKVAHTRAHEDSNLRHALQVFVLSEQNSFEKANAWLSAFHAFASLVIHIHCTRRAVL